MAIKFKVIEKDQSGVAGCVVKKYYASTRASCEMTLAKLTSSIEKVSAVSGADIRAVLYTIVDGMKASLADGQIVRLGELGSLRINISGNGEATAEKVMGKSVKGAKNGPYTRF